MPIATPFNAGKGNGFPFCISTLDVNDRGDGQPYEFWITLGGTQKGSSPTQTEIDLSLENAMKIFWNYNGHKFNSYEGEESEIDIEDEVYGSINPIDMSDPISRICINNNWYSFGNSTTSEVVTRAKCNVKRMYDGSVFLGYGAQDAFIGLDSNVFFKFSSTLYEDTGGSSSVVAYNTNFDGIPFVCTAGLDFGSSYNVSISGLTANFTDPDPDPNNFSISFSEVSFYTYA